MKTCLSQTEADRIKNYVNAWSRWRSLQESIVRHMACDLGTSQEAVLDLLNRHDDYQQVLDALGIEVVADFPAPYQYTEEDLSGPAAPNWTPFGLIIGMVLIVFFMALWVAS